MTGGGAGTLLRFWLGSIIPFVATDFAWATFLVNMAGCFAIGGCYPWITDPAIRAILVVGVLGGFTTFSGFGLEVFRYLEQQEFKLAALYGMGSIILGTVLVYIGYRVGLWLQ